MYFFSFDWLLVLILDYFRVFFPFPSFNFLLFGNGVYEEEVDVFYSSW